MSLLGETLSTPRCFLNTISRCAQADRICAWHKQVYKGSDEVLLSSLILDPVHSILKQSFDSRLRLVSLVSQYLLSEHATCLSSRGLPPSILAPCVPVSR